MRSASTILVVILLGIRILIPNISSISLVSKMELEIYLVFICGILLFIYFERNRLASFLIDKQVFFYILIGCIIQTVLAPSGKLIVFLLYLLLSIGITVLYKKKIITPVQSKNFGRNLILGFFVGVFIIAVPTFMNKILGHQTTFIYNIRENVYSMAIVIFSQTLFEFFTVAVVEEVFFRGILVGAMIHWGIHEKWAWILQGILFWFAHFGSFTNLSYPLIFLPLASLVFTFVAYKTKSLMSGVIAHGLYNSFSRLLN
jgi:membrane protease YdiL (CAAX protease family)